MTRSIFFSGKGGVGKTSMACATAVRHADEGRRTLIVTTNPAAHLGDVPVLHIPLLPAEVRGLEILIALGERLLGPVLERSLA